MVQRDVENSHKGWRDEFSGRTPLRDSLLGAVVLIIITFLGARFYVSAPDPDAPVAEAGVISLAGWDLEKRTVELEGDWEFYLREFLASDDMATDTAPVLREVPGVWNNLDNNQIPEYRDKAYATYRLLITDVPAGFYALNIPILYAPAKVWVNGTMISETGIISREPAEERTVWKGHFGSFRTDGGDIEVLVEISDQIHGGGGFQEAPVFGTLGKVSDFQVLYAARDLIVQGIATVLFIFGFVLFLFRRQDKASLYFGLFCLAFGTTLSYLGVNISEIVIPEYDFWTKIWIFYLAEIASYCLFTLYFSSLYPDERVRPVNWLVYLLSAIILIYVTVHLWAKPVPMHLPWFTRYILAMFLLILPYFIFVVIRAVINRREGAVVLLAGFSILLLTSATQIAITQGWVPAAFGAQLGLGSLSLGFTTFLIAQVIVLAQRWTKTLQTSERMTQDLSRLVEVTSAISSEVQLESLLQRIVHGATEFLHAERSTLYLYDERTDELWSLVAEGIGNKEIRFPATSGIAGACFQTGETINVEDAYADPRFNRIFDKENNFTTRTILTMPVESKSGKRLGVMQVLNKIGRRFNSLDEQRLRAFAAQAAISIENAELFGEVVEARNYNESILGSMSNGVLTLGADGAVAKINLAALNILGGAETDFMDQEEDIWLFSGENIWIAEELESVRAEGQPRTLLDVDVVTQDESTKSLNLSIVPLVAEEGQRLGELLLLEDITDEKRLRGTMSRFMTKEVADRILESGEDALQGAACRASILFADLRNFTGISEELGARETVAMLNEFFSDMVEAIFNWKGVLDKFIGDSIMAVYGAPVSTGTDTDNAVRSAIEMMQILGDLNLRRRERGGCPAGSQHRNCHR